MALAMRGLERKKSIFPGRQGPGSFLYVMPGVISNQTRNFPSSGLCLDPYRGLSGVGSHCFNSTSPSRTIQNRRGHLSTQTQRSAQNRPGSQTAWPGVPGLHIPERVTWTGYITAPGLHVPSYKMGIIILLLHQLIFWLLFSGLCSLKGN